MIVMEAYLRMHIGLLRNNYCGMLEFRWSSRVPVMSSVDWHSIRTLKLLKKAVSKAAASEDRRRTLWGTLRI